MICSQENSQSILGVGTGTGTWASQQSLGGFQPSGVQGGLCDSVRCCGQRIIGQVIERHAVDSIALVATINAATPAMQ